MNVWVCSVEYTNGGSYVSGVYENAQSCIDKMNWLNWTLITGCRDRYEARDQNHRYYLDDFYIQK